MDGHPAPKGADRIPPTGRLAVITCRYGETLLASWAFASDYYRTIPTDSEPTESWLSHVSRPVHLDHFAGPHGHAMTNATRD